MKYALILIALTTACGTSNEVAVNGGTENRIVVTIEHRIPVCEDELFDTAEAKQACIEAVTSQTIDAEVLAADLSDDQIDAILGVSND